MVKKISNKKEKMFFVRQRSSKHFLAYFFIFALLTLSFGFIYFFNNPTTGNLILNLETSYNANESLKGDLNLGLKEGELIPADSEVIITIGGEEKMYKLSELVNIEKSSGNFFIRGNEISGDGEGFGKQGNYEVYPDVEFTMRILDQGSSGGGGSTDSGESSDSSGEEEIEEDDEENDSEANLGEGDDTEDTSEIENNFDNEEENVGEVNEEGSEEILEESGESEGNEGVGDEESEESSSNEEGSAESESSEKPSEESLSNGEGSAESGENNGESGESGGGAPITGSVIEEGNLIEGIVSKNSHFEYDLNEGENAEIIYSNENVNLDVSDQKAIVTTDYSEIVEGFGENYLGSEEYNLNIDLDSLDIGAEEGNLKIVISYLGEEISSIETELSVGTQSVVSEEEKEVVLEENFTLSNETINDTLRNETVTEINKTAKFDLSDYELSDGDLFLIQSKIGADKVSVTKSEIVGDRLVVKFELGDYWLETSFNQDSENLDFQVEKERVKWVKNVANSLRETKESNNQIENYVGEYSI
jgi:hypothetical protein